MEKDVARAVGLWLAEGDSKTIREITFTNNCFVLVEFFHKTTDKMFADDSYRLYVYRPSEDESYQKLQGCSHNFYMDDRATQTYYVFRYASTEAVKEWKDKVEEIKSNKNLYSYILQGFFAGEGSVYEGNKRSRRLRISQGEKNEFIEDMMDYFSFDYHFRPEGRSYIITKKRNWDIASDIDLAYMHPRKKRKFNKIYNSFQEEHYQKGHLKHEVYKVLDKPWKTKELAQRFERSQARLCDVVMELEEEGKIQDYKVGSQSYWIRKDENSIILSEKKQEYLDLLNSKQLKVGQIADHFEITKSSAYKHLHRLEELGLIKKIDHEWKTVEVDKKVIIL